MAPSRVRSLIAAAAVAVLSLSACSTGPADSGTAATGGASASADAFPVTIEHAFGETTLTEKPERVATVSWVNADVSLALGVVPVGMPADSYGGNENQSTPWKDARLEELDAAIGTENAPVQYSETDGIAFDDIAATNPDVILAAYSGLSQEDYDTLSKIAPVVAYPEVAYGTDWKDMIRLNSEGIGLAAEGEQLISDIESQIKDAVAKSPQIAGKRTMFLTHVDTTDLSEVSFYT